MIKYNLTDENLKKAEEYSRSVNLNMGKVNQEIVNSLKKVVEIHSFYLVPEKIDEFRAYTFFKRQEMVRESVGTNLEKKIISCVYKTLEKYGRGCRDQIKVHFEWDSDENIQLNHDGNYYNRMR